MSIPSVNNNAPVQQNPQVMGDGTQVGTEDQQKIAAEAATIIQGASLFVDIGETVLDSISRVGGKIGGKDVDVDEVPELDEESVKSMITILDDLEKLIAELKSESTEEQIQLTKERIASLRDKLKTQHKDRLDKVETQMEQIDAATDAKKSQEKMGILSCVLAVVSAVVAVAAVLAAVFTGGASIAIGIAVIAGIGALCNVASAALTIYQTVEQDKLEQEVKDKAAEYRKQGMSSSEAWKKASSEVNDKFLIANLCLSIGGMIGGLALGGTTSVSNVVQIIGLIQTGLSAASMVSGAVNAGIQSDASDKSYDSQATQAELQHLEALLEKLKKALEEDSDELQALIQQLMEAMTQLAQLLESAVSATDEIVQQTGETA